MLGLWPSLLLPGHQVGQERQRLQEILMQNHRELLELSTTTTPDDKKAASGGRVESSAESFNQLRQTIIVPEQNKQKTSKHSVIKCTNKLVKEQYRKVA